MVEAAGSRSGLTAAVATLRRRWPSLGRLGGAAGKGRRLAPATPVGRIEEKGREEQRWEAHDA